MYKCVETVIKNYPRLRLTYGRKVLYRTTMYAYPSILDFVSQRDCCLNLLFISNVKVLEVRPVINWHKGKAVMFLLESLGR